MKEDSLLEKSTRQGGGKVKGDLTKQSTRQGGKVKGDLPEQSTRRGDMVKGDLPEQSTRRGDRVKGDLPEQSTRRGDMEKDGLLELSTRRGDMVEGDLHERLKTSCEGRGETSRVQQHKKTVEEVAVIICDNGSGEEQDDIPYIDDNRSDDEQAWEES